MPVHLRTEAVLHLLTGKEPADVVCRRFGACRRCLGLWRRAFVTHGIAGLAAPETAERTLAAELRELRRALTDAREELQVWDCIAAAVITFPALENPQANRFEAERDG